MRIIFQNGEIAELTNVDKIVVYNPGERRILKEAISEYFFKELDSRLIGRDLEPRMEGNDEHSSSKTGGDGSISKCNMAQEGSQHAGQTGVCDLPSGGEKKEIP